VPFWFIHYFSLSGIGYFFSENILYSIVSGGIILYFAITGIYYYRVNINPYMIKVQSYRVVFELFKTKDYIDIPHSMLVGFRFFNRPSSFNNTLMLKIQTNSKKKITKRFNFSFISKEDIQTISKILEGIIEKNR
jgi:hypothetical protein